MERDDALRIEAVAGAFRAAAPAGWESIRLEVSSISSVTAFVAHAVLASGEVESFYIADDEAEEDALDELDALRREMAGRNGDRGAWFVMRLEVAQDGEYSASFDYDSEPVFDFEVSREALLADLREFPRAEEFYPSWARG